MSTSKGQRFTNIRITNGRNVWTVSGRVVADGEAVLTEVHGDINDVTGIGEALARHFDNTCRWFAGCTRPATGTTPHPVLGDVATCDKCHTFATGEKRKAVRS